MGMVVQPSRFSVGGPGPGPGGDYRRYRVDIVTNNGDTQYVGLDELYAYATVGGADILRDSGGTGGTFTANSSFSGYPAAQAFDFDDATAPAGWVSGGGTSGWLRYNAPAPISLTHFGLRTMMNETGRMPKDFKLRYSDDAATWSDALSFTGAPAWAQDEIRMWEVPPGLGAHTYWELQIIANQGDGYCSIGNCIMIKNDGKIVHNSVYNCVTRCKSEFYTFVAGVLNRDASYWVSNSGTPVGEWFEFITAENVAQFGFKCKEPLRMPKDFTLKGWNISLGAWELIDTYGPETAWSIGETRKFTLP